MKVANVWRQITRDRLPGLLALVAAFLFLLGCSQWVGDTRLAFAQAEGQQLPVTARAVLGGETIALEVARSPREQQIGLMFREELAGDRGMLFPFDPPRVARFWMKNVSIALDMLFLRDGKVVYIAAEVPPCERDPCPSYGPDRRVDRVLELRGGRAAELGVEVGDRVEVVFLDGDN